MKISKEKYERIEKETKKYLALLRRGEFSEARSIGHGLEYWCYVLDPVWVEADKKNRARR